MRFQKRIRHPRLTHNTLLVLVIPLLLLLHRPYPHKITTKPTLPIHQISLSRRCISTQTTNIHSSTTLSPSSVLSHLSTLPNDTIIFLTASCVAYTANTRELLYLSLLHHAAPAVVPYLSPSTSGTVSQMLPILLRAGTLRGSDTLEHALEAIQPAVLEIPAAVASSHCDIFETPLSRAAITNRSARMLPTSLYGRVAERLPPSVAHVPFISPAKKVPTILFVAPWLQMGGSEQCLFHLATYARRAGYRVAFVVTQPFWGEIHGRLVTKNDWIHRGYEITEHVYDLVNVAPYHARARVLRYLLSSLQPEYIITANSRLFYQLLPFVRAVLNGVVIGDYNHMVHIDWLGGGMPRYGANATEFIDRHFGASQNVTNAMKGWVSQRGYDVAKARTCYIGADVNTFHTGLRKHWARRTTRARFGIADDTLLVLFAGRFVLDKGVDVLASVIMELSSDDRVGFLLAGSGALEGLVHPLQREGSVVVTPSATKEEMRDYYAAADVLLLPSVKEGIALVVYEAMANGLLVITTDVGGQKEVVTRSTGVLLNRGPTETVARDVVRTLADVHRRPLYYARVRAAGERIGRERYTIDGFSSCVFDGLKETRPRAMGTLTKDIVDRVGKVLQEERMHSVWAWRVFPQSVQGALTFGVTPRCTPVEDTVEKLRKAYPGVAISTGENFGKVLENVHTELVMLIPTGYKIDEVNMQEVVNLVRRPVKKVVLDMVGLRVKGAAVGRLIQQKESISLCTVGNIDEFSSGKKTLMSLDAANVVEVGVDVFKIDWFGDVFVVRTERLKEVSGVITGKEDLFLEASRRNWNVGYVHDFVVQSSCGRGRVGVVDGVRDGGDCGWRKDYPWYRIKF